MSNESIERFGMDHWYIPEHDDHQSGMVPLPDGEYVRYSDHQRIVKELEAQHETQWREHLKTCQTAVKEVVYATALSDAIKEVEKLYDEWWDIDRQRWLNVVLDRLKSLGTQRED